MLLSDYHRCLAYDVPHPQLKKLIGWCDKRESCARALALRSDQPNMPGRVIKYRVCEVGKDDAYIPPCLFCQRTNRMSYAQRLMEAVQSLASLLSPDAEQPYQGEMVDLLESAKARIKTLEGANAAYQRVIDFDQLQAQQETISVLKNEIKLIGEAINDPRVDLTMTMSEVITETRQKPVAVGLAYLYRVYMHMLVPPILIFSTTGGPMKKLAFVFAFFLSAAAMAGEGHTTSKPEHPSKPNTPAVVAPVALATSTTTVKTGDTKAVASTGPITINVEASSNSGKGKGKGGGGKKPEAPSGGSGSGSGGNTGNVLSASTGDQIFAPVIGWGSGGFGGSGTTTIKNVADPNPPSMPAVTPCTTGASAGVGWAGGVFSFGGYYKDLMCLWERMHAVAVATNDEKGASEIREGMTMMLCEDTPPERRKFFKQCEALARAQSEGAQPPRNRAFNSD